MSEVRLRSLGVVAVLFLFTAVAGSAQPAASNPPPIPADVLVPNDESRAVFEALESDSAAAQRFAALPSEMAAPMDAVIEMAFAPGELVPGWHHAGVELRRIAGARDGGASGSMAAATGPLGSQLIYFVDEPVDSIASPDWILVARDGQPFQAEEVRIEVTRMSPKVIMAERVGYRRLGQALCRERSESRLYSDPRIPASEADVIAVGMTMRLLPTLNRRNLCHVVEEREPGVFFARYFNGEGRRLPAFDAESPAMRITARAPISTRSDRP
jgi:hypothetical protein